jgi:ABC-type transporter MlaC component
MKTRSLLVLMLLAVSTIAGWGADELKLSEAQVKDALRSVVDAQLNAFRQDDYAGAYVFSDVEFRHQCPLDRFERMVRVGYPAIAHSTSARCGLAFDNGEEAVINVRVFSEGREPVDYQYLLRRDGQAWRITGVTLLKDQTTEV